MIISVDMGHGYGKFYNGQEAKIFPAILGEVQSELMGRNGRQQIETKDGVWYVGQTALTQSYNLIRGQDTNWVFTPERMALMLYGISEYVSQSTDHVVIDMVSGLTIEDYRVKREQVAERILGVHKVTRPGRRNLSIEIRNVKHLPQGFAPSRPFAGKFKTIATLDLGSRNNNFTTFKGTELIDIQTGSNENGAMNHLRDISKKIVERTGLELPEHEIVEAIKTKEVEVQGNPVDISDIISYRLEMYYKSVTTLIRTTWGNALDISRFIVFGGGALLVGDRLTQEYKQAIVLDKPQWANAYSQYEYAKKIFR